MESASHSSPWPFHRSHSDDAAYSNRPNMPTTTLSEDWKADDKSKGAMSEELDEKHFFPFASEAERQQADFATLRRAIAFPWMGAAGILGSIALLILSWGILFVVNKRSVDSWDPNLPRPAAILSAVVSVTAIALHTALSEGANVAWWYRAKTNQATLADLHTLWMHGSSLPGIVTDVGKDLMQSLGNGYKSYRANGNFLHSSNQAKRRFTYLGAATLFAACIPANGVFLQNAVKVITVPKSESKPLWVPLARSTVFAQNNGTGILDAQTKAFRTWTPTFAYAVEYGAMGAALPETAYVNLQRHLLSLTDESLHCEDECYVEGPGLGFEASVVRSKVSYNYNINSPDVDPSLFTDQGSTVFSVDVAWGGVDNPDVIILTVLWKYWSTCEGNLWKSVYTLNMVDVIYPVFIKNKVELPWTNELQNSTLMMIDPKVNILAANFTKVGDANSSIINDMSKEYGGLKSTYAGLANLIYRALQSKVTIHYSNDTKTYSYQVSGIYASYQFADYTTDNFVWTNDNCDASFYGIDYYYQSTKKGNKSNKEIWDMGIEALAAAKQLVFASSAYFAMSAGDQDNTIYGTQQDGVANWKEEIYVIDWAWYFGSLGVVLGVVGIITPTFWGFWTLDRKTTMSPVETARPLHAPFFAGHDEKTQTKKLLKDIGNTHISTTTVGVQPPAPARVRTITIQEVTDDVKAGPSTP